MTGTVQVVPLNDDTRYMGTQTLSGTSWVIDFIEAAKPKPPGKLGAEKLTPKEQRRRFEGLAREAVCDETSEAQFNEALLVIVKQKSQAQTASDPSKNARKSLVRLYWYDAYGRISDELRGVVADARSAF